MNQDSPVDTTTRYGDEYTRESFGLIAIHTLSATFMNNNCIPQFMMRQVGINAKTAPKFQVEDPSIGDHSE